MNKKEFITKLKVRLSNFIIDEFKNYGFETTSTAAQWIKDIVDWYANIVINTREFRQYDDEDELDLSQMQYDILGEICTNDTNIYGFITWPNNLACKKIVRKSYKNDSNFCEQYNKNLFNHIETDYFNYIWENYLNENIYKCCAKFIEEFI